MREPTKPPPGTQKPKVYQSACSGTQVRDRLLYAIGEMIVWPSEGAKRELRVALNDLKAALLDRPDEEGE